VAGHIEVQYPAPPVLDHKEGVQQLERHRWHSEEIECRDDFRDDSVRTSASA
jgi:hypothetical protein